MGISTPAARPTRLARNPLGGSPPGFHRTILYYNLSIVCLEGVSNGDDTSPPTSGPAPIEPRKPLLRALSGIADRTPPIWLMRQAGRYLPEYRALRGRAGSFLDLCYDSDLAAEATLQPVRRFGLDAAILFSDILVVPHALGRDVRFEEGIGPRLEPVRDLADLAGVDAAGVADRLAPVYRAVRRARDALPPRTALIGFAGAPWTVASYMVEGGGSRTFARAVRWAEDAPESFGSLIDLLTDAAARHLIAQVESGAEAVQIFDSWAGVLPEASFRRCCVHPVAAIVTRVRAACPQVPVIVFARLPPRRYLELARDAAPDAVSVDDGVDPGWARRMLQPHCAVQGNLDPLLLVRGGEPMEREAGRILDALGGGAFVFNLGRGVVPETPPDHVAQLVEIVRTRRR